MKKVIIHAHISNVSYAFTVADIAFRTFEQADDQTKSIRLNFPDNITAVVIPNEFSVRVIVDYTDCGHYTELTEVEDDNTTF